MKTIWNLLNREVSVKLYVYILDVLLVVAAWATLWGNT